MLTDKNIQDNWWEFKGGVRNLWGRITNEELDQSQGNLAAILELVQQKYGESRDTISEKMQSLLNSFDNTTDKNHFYTSSYMRSPLGPDEGAVSDIRPGAQGVPTAEHDTSGFTEDTEEGVDYNTAKVNEKNVRDFDHDRNARH